MEKLTARWRSLSLRTQLMVLTGLLLMPSILLTSFVSISVVRDSLVNSIDNELRESLGERFSRPAVHRDQMVLL